MAWLRIDDRVRTHPKVVSAGPAAAWFWFCGICYCREHLTDGLILDGMLASLAPGVRNGKTLAAKLVAANLWHRVDGGYQVHDFLDWNPTRAEVLAKRAADLERKKGGKNTGSRVESEEIPDGIHNGIRTESAATRDACVTRAGAGSGLGSKSLEGGAGGNRWPTRHIIQSPAEFDRIHGKHVTEFCDWVCLPSFVFDKSVTRVMGTGVDEEVARQQVLAWARGVRERWTTSGQIPGDDELVFWRNEWAATYGSNRPALKGAAPDAPIRRAKDWIADMDRKTAEARRG